MKQHFCPAEQSMIAFEKECNWCGEREESMNEIIEMAQECNLIGMRPHLDGIYSESLVAFAHLVAAKEREACAKVCDDWPNGRDDVYSIGVAIRARGKT